MVTQPPSRTKSQFERIDVPPGASFAWKEISGTHFEAPFHHHPEVELTIITEGYGQRFVGDTVEPFQPGDAVLLGSHLAHAWFSAPGCRRSSAIVVHFHPESFGGGVLRAQEMDSVRALLAEAAGGTVILGAMAAEMREGLAGLGDRSPVTRLTTLLLLLEKAALSHEKRGLQARAPDETVSPVDRRRLDDVLRYIHAHHHKQLGLPEISKVAGLGPESFSRFFRRVTGHTFIETLIQIRLASALALLNGSTDTIAAVAYASGFEDLSNFNRQFRRAYGVTPSEARRRAQGGTAV